LNRGQENNKINDLKLLIMKEQVVLSLFNGMNTLRQAMENIGIPVKKYYSSEIKPYAIKLTQYHFPDTIQLGDIKNWRDWDIDWSEITFIGSGSPCQDLSSIGKRKGLNGGKSSLFFDFIDILNHCKTLNPDVKFLQENVGSANKFDIGIMSRLLGIYPVRLNSDKLVAQQRDRYYWTNIKTKQSMFDTITDIPEPTDKNIILQDIITSGYVKEDKHKALMHRMYYSFGHKDKLSEKAQKYIRDREKFGNTVIYENGYLRLANKIELCRLQGFPDDYCDILNLRESASLLGDGWTLPIIEHILSFYKN
jgi:DNA (cytosine-5)-methyltransferase 1